MNGHIGYLLFQVLPVLGICAYTGYLAFVVSSPRRLQPKMAKHKEGTPGYDLYRRVYSQQSLGAWVCIALSFIIQIAFGAYKSMYTPPILAIYLALISSLALLLVGASLTVRAFKK